MAETSAGQTRASSTTPDFFGPTRVLDEEQGGGIGRALLLRSLAAMRAEGYAYAVIGGVGPQEFYKKCVGAMLIPDSVPGISSFVYAFVGRG